MKVAKSSALAYYWLHSIFLIIRRKALKKWKHRNGSAATYSNLIKVFKATGNQGYVHGINKLLTQSCHTRGKKEVQQDLADKHCSEIKFHCSAHQNPIYPKSDPLTVVTKTVIISTSQEGIAIVKKYFLTVALHVGTSSCRV